MRTKHLKRLVITVLGIAMIMAIAVGGTTMAWLAVKTNTLNNELKVERPEIKIEENFKGWTIKEVSLKNNSLKVSGVVRARLVPRVVNALGNYVEADLAPLAQPISNKSVTGDFTFEFADDWAANWFFKDGAFYCRKVLNPGERSPLLLKKVSLTNNDQAHIAKYKDLQVKVDVMSDILQAEGGAPKLEWGINVNGSTVSES